MKNITNKAFTLVELLVVITILAIISVVAYQNFGWAVDKATSWRKISDVSTIETSLQQYRSANNYYPPVWEYNDNNMWWYTWSFVASKSNKIQVTYNWQEIETVLTWTWWWKIYWSWSLWQIWAKWTIWKNELWQYLTKDLYDPEVWDINVNNIDWHWNKWKMIDKWIGRYVYRVYKKSYSWPANQNWTSYNIAFTIKKDWQEEWYITKIVWDYDKVNYGNLDTYPETLIWTMSWSTTLWVLLNWDEQNWPSNTNDYWVPYAVNDFAQ